MADRLLIHYIPDSDQPVSWVLLNEQGQTVSAIQQGTLDDARPPAGYKTTLLMDSARIQLQSVQIPTNKINRQRQAVPFALEDRLASDIDDTHFALGKKLDNGLIPVASIDRHLLDTTLESFKQAGVKIDYLMADVLALPDETTHNGWSILIAGQSCLIRTGPFSGHYCDRDNLPLITSSLIQQAEMPPESITLLHQDTDLELDALFSDLQLPLKKISWKNSVLQVFSEYIHETQQLNLLQDDYAPKRESNALLQPWKAVAAIAAILVMLQLIYAGILGQQLEAKNNLLAQQIEQQFKQAIPSARKFNNMRNRMERTLKELRSGKGMDQPDFLHLLSTASAALGTDKKIIIQAMVYRNQHIDLELQADSLDSLENLKAKLTSLRNIKAVLSTSIEKDKVNGRLRLEKQG